MMTAARRSADGLAAIAALPPDLAELVRTLKATHGRTWKTWVRQQWTRGRDANLLRRLRNTVGPKDLDTL